MVTREEKIKAKNDFCNQAKADVASGQSIQKRLENVEIWLGWREVK